MELKRANEAGTITEPDFLESHGWFLLKYHCGAWYAEFVFLGYKLAMASVAIFLDSPDRIMFGLSLMIVTTVAYLCFHLKVRPYVDGNDQSSDISTAADKLQILSLVTTIVALCAGLLSAAPGYGSKDRNTIDVVINVTLSFVSAAPLLAPLLFRDFKEENETKEVVEDEKDAEDTQATKINEPAEAIRGDNDKFGNPMVAEASE